MSDRFDVCVVTKYQKDGQDKSRWNKVGAAFANKLGGFNIKLDGPTVIVPGVNDLVIVPPKEQAQPY